MSVLLFAGDDYYPLGGARDLQGKYETAEEAIKAHDPTEFTYEGGWSNILDLESLQTVGVFDRGQWYKSIEEWEDGRP